MFYWVMRALAAPLVRAFFRPWIRGAKNVPADGPVILASNHLAVIDSVVLPILLSRKVRFIGKAEYFNGRGLKGRLQAAFVRGVGTIPVDRGGGKASEAALRTGLSVLEEGGVFGIYPEGTRSPDGRLYRGKTGVARLAIDSGAPVVPVAMIGTEKAQPIGRVIPKPVRVGIVIGEPMDFSRYRGMGQDRFILRSVTDEIMYALMSLSGQEYVDMYAATAKARIAAGHKPDEVASAEQGHGAPGGRAAPHVQVPVPPEVPEPPQ
ncbi:lysophospholipid acyltransferase family protein [Actinotalea fermentans]|uniref:1-acyl-sn-glycerol-3-phosphate acyltransferase n=1 Tax=Actinotalea fermentans TaxID=43671 RepID=A0A511YU18_9CELL|nr:lysophospholipid acyltransferase family protein [Actinotalea fermentans]KGM17288.1 acyl-phosphate glycerol 3-phosphate acyltransferase [Actinotalea fermentans ATCC 43279 = JCM 9966 = DSM 3133]GEN78689.1 1-acyl-sn-glycerol-3-phosphate acyltransferase [Actinotalea fermentans]